MVESWNNYLLHLYQNYRVLFGIFSVLFFCAAGATIETVTRWPSSRADRQATGGS